MLQAVKDLISPMKTDPDAEAWHRQNILTPDMWKLEQSMFQLIFIPDDFMRGKVNNHLIAEFCRDGDTPLHPSCFTFERFTFWKKDLGEKSFPIPLEKGYDPSGYLRVRPIPAKIKGQLYAILSNRIKTLDIHRQNGLQFRRTRIEVSLPFRTVSYSVKSPLPVISPDYLVTKEAWMYVGIPEYWDPLISDMFTVRECDKFTFNEPKFWADEYYKFE